MASKNKTELKQDFIPEVVKEQHRKNKDDFDIVEITIKTPPRSSNLVISSLNKQKVKIKGFRTGKISREMYERQFGKVGVYAVFLQQAYDNLIKSTKKYQPISQPRILNVSVLDAGELKATLEFDSQPILNITMAHYRGVEIEIPDVPVLTEEQVEERIENSLESIRHSNALLKPNEDPEKAVGAKDVAFIDIKGICDGKEHEFLCKEDFRVEMESSNFFRGINAHIKGMKINETKETTLLFSSDKDIYAELAEKEVKVKFTIKSIKEFEYPELTDEFVQANTAFKTLDELKQNHRKNLNIDIKRHKDTQLQNIVLDKVINNIGIKVPPVMIQNEIQSQLNHYMQTLKSQGVPEETIPQFLSQIDKHQLTATSDFRVKVSLILNKLVDDQAFTVNEVTDEQVEEYYKNMAIKRKIELHYAKELVPEAEVKLTLLYDHVIAYMVNNAKVNYVKPPPEIVQGEEREMETENGVNNT